jgi:hypothetical protein
VFNKICVLDKMFANLKNKIREETGSDLSQLAPKLTGVVQQRVAAGFRDMRNRGSTSSLSALEEESVGSPEDGTDGMKMAAASIKVSFMAKLALSN